MEKIEQNDAQCQQILYKDPLYILDLKIFLPVSFAIQEQSKDENQFNQDNDRARSQISQQQSNLNNSQLNEMDQSYIENNQDRSEVIEGTKWSKQA